MSTHILSTAEKFCDRFIVLHEGRLIADGTIDELREQFDLPNQSLDEIYLHLTKVGGASAWVISKKIEAVP